MAARATLIPRLLIAACLLPAGIFIYAGALKAWDPMKFLEAIEGYCLLPFALAVAASFYMPWLEIAAALALFVPRLRLPALAILGVLTATFLAALVSVQVRGIELLTCGCFGSPDQPYQPPNVPHLIAQDFLLLALLAVLSAVELRLAPRASATDHHPL